MSVLKYFNQSTQQWETLAKGDKGDTGPEGPVGPASTIPGPQGPPGQDGVSIPTGGTAGQQLVKKSSTDYDYEWETPPGGGDMLSSVYDPSNGKKQVAFQDTTYTKTEVDTKIANATPADATTASKGVIKLAGALGGTADLPTVPGLATKEPTIASGTTSQYYRGDKTWQTLNKAAVGLSNVDNTSDANKPVSTATQSAIDAVIANGVDGFHAALTPTANKIPVLDENAKMPLTTIPGYAFKARRTTNLSSSSNSSIDIVFDGKLYDFGNWYSASTGLATAPVNGVYHFEASAFVETTPASRAFFISRGSALGTQERGIDPDSANIRRAKGTWEIYMTAGQTFGVSLYTSASNQLNNVDTWLTGHLVIAR